MSARKIILIICHLAFWAIIYYMLRQVMGTQTIENVQIINGTMVKKQLQINPTLDVYLVLIMSAMLFYANTLFLLPGFLKAKKIVNYLILLMMLIILCISSSLFLSWIFSHQRPSEYAFPIYLSITVYGAILGLSFAWFFIVEWFKNEQIKRLLREENLKTELNFLRAQVQPHFLFNVLNNLFYMARETGHRELIDGISSLSTMMRYMVYEGNTDTVTLAREVTYLDHYIQLHAMKFAAQDKIKFEFTKDGDFQSVTIAPFLLLPMVENAFKYGINFEAESIIQMKLEIKSSQLHFKVRNTDFSSIHANNQEKSGIGLENVKKRLALIYPSKHEFTAESKDGFFETNLVINFQ